MFFNHFVDILMILGGILVSLGIVGGCFFLFSLFMGWVVSNFCVKKGQGLVPVLCVLSLNFLRNIANIVVQFLLL